MSLWHHTGRSGIALVGDIAGPARGPAVVLLHGGGQTRHSWGGALDALAADGFRALALDQRGHGDSGWSPDGDYRIDRFVDDLAEVLDCLGQPAALVGASLGGLTALLAAGERLPAAVRALVLVDIVPDIDATGAREIADFMTSAGNGFASVDEAADAVAAYLPHRPRPRDTRGLLRNLRRGADGRWRWHWDPRLLAGEMSLQPEATNQRLNGAARRLAVPTLLIRGALSRVVTPAAVESFRRLVPGAEYVNVEKADHMVAGDRNDAFNAPLLDFLHRVIRPSRTPQTSPLRVNT